MTQVLILDNGEKVFEMQLDGTTYTAYKNTAAPNTFNIVRHCSFDETTSVIALPKVFLKMFMDSLIRY